MKILAIETSCDETAVAILEANGTDMHAEFTVLGDALYSQIDIHREYGGVFPNLAKREHAKNLVPLLSAALEEAEMLHEDAQVFPSETYVKWGDFLFREPGLTEQFISFIEQAEAPDIDVIAVTHGPGLEPALWVGVNFARALSLAWDKPIVPINHLEGHILAGIAGGKDSKLEIREPRFPLLALGIAGGHTDLVLMRSWLSYEKIGNTLDDSVGEAFDKVARMLDLPYPGGPEISKLAEIARLENAEQPYSLPRPMLHSGTYEFSFSGLKTAVLYLLKKKGDVSEEDKKHIAREFEDAVADVLWKKTAQALDEFGAETLIISGGVAANQHIRRRFENECREHYPSVELRMPLPHLNTDNAIMIGLAGFYRASRGQFADIETLAANGNLSLA